MDAANNPASPKYITSAFEYYAKRKYVPNPEDYAPFKKRKDLTKELQTNAEFKRFWERLSRRSNRYANQCDRLLSPRKRFKPQAVQKEYERFLKRKEFDRLRKNDTQFLTDEVSSWRQDAYRDWVEETAYENGSNDFIFPCIGLGSVPEPDKEPLRLEDLPSEVFGRILHYLTAFEIFKMTLVCKGWKDLLFKNQEALIQKAEYSMASYIADKISWKNVFQRMMDSSVEEKHKEFSSNLIDWFLKHFKDVETVTLYHGMKLQDLAVMLQQCPHLKHLIMHDYVDYRIGRRMNSRVFSQLEMLICYDNGDLHYSLTVRDLLERCVNLRVLHSETLSWSKKGSGVICRENGVLSKLVALELLSCGRRVLGQMRRTIKFQMKYLSLNLYHDPKWKPRSLEKKFKTRDCLHKLLSRMPELEVLILLDHTFSLNRSTLKLITKLKLNLRFGIFWSDTVPTMISAATKADKDRIIDCETLTSFKDMLLSKDPNRNLSDIVFVDADPDRRENFDSMGLGFTFSSTPEFPKSTVSRLKSSFDDPILNNYLNLRY